MSDVALRPGQIVQLVSGGPPMTIHLVWGDIATCKWFDVHGDLKQGDFHRKGLVWVSPEPGKEPDVDDYGASLAFGIGKALGALLTLDEILSLASDVVLKHEGRPLWPDRPLKPSKSTPDRIVRVTEDRCPSEPDVWFSWDDMPGICAVIPTYLLREAKDDRKARENAQADDLKKAHGATPTPPSIAEMVRRLHDDTEMPKSPGVPSKGTLDICLAQILDGFADLFASCLVSRLDVIHLCMNVRQFIASHSSPDHLDLPCAVAALTSIDFAVESMRQALGVDGGPVALVTYHNKQQDPGGTPDSAIYKHVLRQQGWKG